MTDNPTNSEPTEKPAGERLFSGALWMIAMRWSIRLLGLVSIVVLARLLDKSDFGVVAMASAVIALPQILLDMGVEQAVIRERNPSANIYNTAWTIRFAQMLAVSLVIFFSAPWIADFYGDTRLIDILRLLALSILIRGMENIWLIALLKTFRFRLDFIYNTFNKVASVIVTVALAFWLQSYWALVFGQLIAATMRLVLSFIIAPGIARPTLIEWRRIWSFSQWSLVKGIADYIGRQGDKLLLGRLAGADVVGLYTVGREIAEIPISEISSPVNRALGPGLSNLQAEPQRLAAAINKSVGAVATVVFPMAIGMALTATELVPIILGPGWNEVSPILQLLAIGSILSSIRGIMGNALVVIGHIRANTIVVWLRALLLLAIGVPWTISAGAVGLAASFIAAEVLSSIAMLYFYRRHVPYLTLWNLATEITRPAAAVLIMSATVSAVNFTVISHETFLLILKIASGLLVYPISLFIFWQLTGRPDGIEKMTLEFISTHKALRFFNR